ncbi:hypothetical protein [Pseudorhodoferax sp. Leaf265]|uniref:hypothetical protein n=1 Tax=Pseudorhodoferax sp. Leaf265 TaxID=1736315 RepID=UPI0012E90F49|nr:hypothetical protein [Pseudorhodoferax sp. Leaf265]
MADRNFNVHVTSDKSAGPPKSWLQEHFSSVLLLLASVIAAVFAMSETAYKLFANQPPVAAIRLGSYVFAAGEYADARVPYSDDGDEEDLHYTWWLKDIRGVTELKRGLGPDNAIVVLGKLAPGKYELIVKLKDKKNRGKVHEDRATFEVTAGPATPVGTVAPSPMPSVSAPVVSVAPKVQVLRLRDDAPVDWSVQRASKIVTNGYKLTLRAESIDEDLLIVSFDGSAVAGESGNPGPPGLNGGYMQAGGSGFPGVNGRDGTNGADANPVSIVVNGAINAKLMIDNSGQSGGAGGSGGDGGPGGSGGQGEPSRSGFLDCSAGPGYGSKGGNGGNGGVGGNGGSGGNAAKVDVASMSRGARADVVVIGKGGSGGAPGAGGRGGAAGAGGPEGQSGGRCSAAGRNGEAGHAGINGQPGRPGSSGASTAF